MAKTVYDIPHPSVPLDTVFGLQNNVIISSINPYRFAIDKTLSVDEPIAMSTLNTPVYSDLTFNGKTYIDDAGNSVTIPTINFQTVLLIVDQSKNIVTTQISGRDGTVKEYIGLDDYRITVMGVITGGNGEYPSVEVSDFIKVLKAGVPIKVTANYLTQFDISDVVVSDFSFPQTEGSNSMQVFNCTLLSDNTVEAITLQSK